MPGGSKWTAEDRIRIFMESLTTNITVAELCRKYNLKPNVFYIWKQRFLEGGKLALTSSKQENVNKDLAAENERLKKLIGELTIANDAFKKR
ncbi:MAG: transposase [Nitrososphaera sp.]|jgi:transposase-like protein